MPALPSTPPTSPPSSPVRAARWTDRAWARWACGAVVLVLGLLCYLVRGWEPAAPFWDENYYVTNAERYLQGVAQFQSHPPLGLMLIAAGEALVGANAGLDTQALLREKKVPGEALPKGYSFAGLRFMPGLFGALGALLFYALAYTLLRHPLQAALASSLYVFENAYVVHFRAAHLDAFQICFTLAFLWQGLRLWLRVDADPARRLPWAGYAWLGLWWGLACMVRINAVVLGALLPLLWWHERKGWAAGWAVDLARKAAVALLAFGLAVFATFYVHALRTQVMPPAGSAVANQDLPKMSPAYRAWLAQPDHTVTPAIVAVLVRDHVRFMAQDHEGVPRLNELDPKENGSAPWRWPFMAKTINYRWDSDGRTTMYIQLAGNALGWTVGLAALVVSALLVLNTRVLGVPLRGSWARYRLVEAMLLLWVLFMAMNLRIGVLRVTYLYHYFIGLLLSYVLALLLWRYLCEVHAGLARRATRVLGGAALVLGAAFVFYLPLSNHWPLTKGECERRNVLSRVVACQ